MELKELINEAFTALTLNKMRTVLASLGIIIGVAAVIALISLGEASQKQIESQIQSLGSNLLTVMPGAQRTGAVQGAAGSNTTLTYADAQAIESSNQITTVDKVSADLTRRSQVTAKGKNTNTQIIGTTPQYSQIRNINMQSGTFITQTDVDSGQKIAVLGPQVVVDLFGENADPIGSTIRIGSISFRVVGVTASKGGSGFFNADDVVYIPLTTAQKQVFGVDYVSSISIAAKNSETMTTAQNEVGYLLLARHKLSDPTQADFTIQSQADILGAASQVTGTFTALLSGIAAISLLVGGIGIMNIMLVTVTERTREIGLRKALGAKRKSIITQFLAESIILTITGGILGIILGVSLSFLLSSLINIPFTISLSAVLLAIGVSGGIGIMFGWYPAQQAAKLSPIEALRYE